MENTRLFDKVYGTMIGGLIGDAMGAPAEGLHWTEIEKRFGRITEFEGAGTDDSAIKQILCEAIIDHEGYVTCDEFAESFLRNEKKYYELFFVPVRNMIHKIKEGDAYPVDAGYGNTFSSSSAMVIAPMGVINACNPRQATVEAFEVAGLIHAGPVSGFCRDAAAAIAAAVAEAFKPDATVDSVLEASTKYLHVKSAEVIKARIKHMVENAKALGNYEDFRRWFYDCNKLTETSCDSRETIPVALALFYLAKGDMETAAVYAANFGRDSDTIGTMAGAIAGALNGASGIRKDWVEKIEAVAGTHQAVSSEVYHMDPVLMKDQKVLSLCLTNIIKKRLADMQNHMDTVNALC